MLLVQVLDLFGGFGGYEHQPFVKKETELPFVLSERTEKPVGKRKGDRLVNMKGGLLNISRLLVGDSSEKTQIYFGYYYLVCRHLRYHRFNNKRNGFYKPETAYVVKL